MDQFFINFMRISIYLCFYSSVHINAISFPMTLFYPQDSTFALMELRRSQIILNKDLNILGYAKENNSSLNSLGTILKWNSTNHELFDLHLNIHFITSGREIGQVFKVCQLYSIDTIAKLGQELFIKIFTNYEKPWYQIFLESFSDSHCPLLNQDSFLNPEYIRMEIIKPKEMECDKKIIVTLSIFRRKKNNKRRSFQIIALAKYNGTIKCADEKQSSSFLFYRRNAYLTDAFVN